MPETDVDQKVKVDVPQREEVSADNITLVSPLGQKQRDQVGEPGQFLADLAATGGQINIPADKHPTDHLQRTLEQGTDNFTKQFGIDLSPIDEEPKK